MSQHRVNKKIILLGDVLILAITIAGIIHISKKADIPFRIDEKNKIIAADNLTYNQSSPIIDDTITAINKIKNLSRENIEIILDRYNIGDKIEIEIQKNNAVEMHYVLLIQFYSTTYLVSIFLVSLFFIIISVFVLIKSHDEKIARTFHLVCISTALIITSTWGNYNSLPYSLGILIRVIFHFSYTLAPAAFLHFILSFPKDRSEKFGFIIKLCYTSAIIIALIQNYFFFLQTKELNEVLINNYSFSQNIARYFSALLIVCALMIFSISFFRSRSTNERIKLKWILVGFVIGPLSYISLWIIPQAVAQDGLVPEEVIVFSMLAVPITFSISIVKHRILDIDLIINRGIVYIVTISVILVIYLGLIGVIVMLLHSENNIFISILSAIVISLLFQPIKTKTQNLVDKKFFLINYNYRISEKEFIELLKNIYDFKAVKDLLLNSIQKVIPLNKIELLLLNGARFSNTAHIPIKSDDFKMIKDYLSNNHVPLGVVGEIEESTYFNYYYSDILWASEIALIFPLYIEKSGLQGILLAGRKKSGFKFTKEDIDLISSFTFNASQTIDRINLQHKLFLEGVEKNKFQELNELKSFFVSAVSHELKTPLTSIKIFTEMLENKVVKKESEYLKIISGETTRLTRLIDNVLNLSKIEKGTLEYNLKEIDIRKPILKAIDSMEYLFELNKISFSETTIEEELYIEADEDAVEEAVINLLSNAVKYSGMSKEISLKIYSEDNFAKVSVSDKGIGISKEELKNIFKAYERSGSYKKLIPGTGIGLALVKHMVQMHNAKIDVDSTPNKGSTFTISFPIINRDKNEKNINNRR